MSRKWILYLAAAAIALPATADAQDRVTFVEEPGKVSTVRTQGGGGRGGAVMAVAEAKIVTGRPYSAEAVTETTQVLGDGNRINRQSAVRVYRDSEGRTRREMLAEDGTVRLVSISDPVANTSYTLNPNEKIAYRMKVNVLSPTRSVGTYTMTEKPSGAVASPAGKPTATATFSGGGGRGGVLTRRPAEDDPNVKKEELAPQNVEGVMATGTRTTTVIPAGRIGNAQEIQIVSERWFSDELQALVLTRHSDPRSGETVYRLRNILRAEPDQSLFTLPADYTLKETTIRRPQ